jgi:hypothetical protein
MPFVKIMELKNEIEANLLAAVLHERRIPHAVRRYADPVLGGFFQTEFGWGCLEGEEGDAEAIRQVFADLKAASAETVDEAAE